MRCTDKVCVDYRQLLVWERVVWISPVLYEPRHYTLRLIHLDVAVMCSDGAQGLLLHLLHPLLIRKAPFFCLFQKSTAFIKSFKIKIRLPFSQVEATCRWLTFCCSLLLSEQRSGPSCSLTLAGIPKTLNRKTESNQHALWDLHKGQYWHTINFHLQFSAWKCFWKTFLLFWLVWERLNGAFKIMIENA